MTNPTPGASLQAVAGETLKGLASQVADLDFSHPWAFERAEALAWEIKATATKVLAALEEERILALWDALPSDLLEGRAPVVVEIPAPVISPVEYLARVMDQVRGA